MRTSRRAAPALASQILLLGRPREAAVLMDADPERDESVLLLGNSASFQNALAAGGLIVLIAWPVAWIVGVVRRTIARHR